MSPKLPPKAKMRIDSFTLLCSLCQGGVLEDREGTSSFSAAVWPNGGELEALLTCDLCGTAHVIGVGDAKLIRK